MIKSKYCKAKIKFIYNNPNNIYHICIKCKSRDCDYIIIPTEQIIKEEPNMRPLGELGKL